MIDVNFILSYICDLSVYLMSYAIRTHISQCSIHFLVEDLQRDCQYICSKVRDLKYGQRMKFTVYYASWTARYLPTFLPSGSW